MEYREVLLLYLGKYDMSQAELARRVGVPRSTINSLATGQVSQPTLLTAKAIADAFGVTLQEMVDVMEGER